MNAARHNSAQEAADGVIIAKERLLTQKMNVTYTRSDR